MAAAKNVKFEYVGIQSPVEFGQSWKDGESLTVHTGDTFLVPVTAVKAISQLESNPGLWERWHSTKTKEAPAKKPAAKK